MHQKARPMHHWHQWCIGLAFWCISGASALGLLVHQWCIGLAVWCIIQYHTVSSSILLQYSTVCYSMLHRLLQVVLLRIAVAPQCLLFLRSSGASVLAASSADPGDAAVFYSIS